MPEEKIQGAARERTPQPFGPFVLERRIAVGGTAEVFQARPRQGVRPAPELVIKRLSKRSGGAEDFEALSREAELHRAVRHENVVTVFGAGMVGNEPYLAMEYVPGVDLHRLLRLLDSENRSLPSLVAVYIARCIADALAAVHSARSDGGEALNLTHGDVSPSNIYLSLEGQVKLGDFGVARASRAAPDGTRDLASPTVQKGKLGYTAPEQLKGKVIDHRSDIFALGVVLGEMLIGEKVFPGGGQLATLLSIREANIEPLRRASGQLPAPLYATCIRALENDPERRFGDASAFSTSLPACESGAARAALAECVAWACDVQRVARELERRLRHSSGVGWASAEPLREGPTELGTACLRRAGVVLHSDIPVSMLLELAATGQIAMDDDVSLLGEPFCRVDAISELARFLVPSTANTTAQLFEPGIPDYTAALQDTPLLDVLARMRNRRESGVLFVSRTSRGGVEERKDIYLQRGRLVHVASSDREQLLGQYVLSLDLITPSELELALANLKAYDGRLSDALIGLGLAERNTLYRAVRNLGRDGVASLCAWTEGRAQLYRGAEDQEVEVPLDLDLSVPMMAAGMISLRQGPGVLGRIEALSPGRRFEDTHLPEERGAAPSSLLDVLDVVGAGRVSLDAALRELIERGKRRQRVLSEREARAAVMVALSLSWVRPS